MRRLDNGRRTTQSGDEVDQRRSHQYLVQPRHIDSRGQFSDLLKNRQVTYESGNPASAGESLDLIDDSSPDRHHPGSRMETLQPQESLFDEEVRVIFAQVGSSPRAPQP